MAALVPMSIYGDKRTVLDTLLHIGLERFRSVLLRDRHVQTCEVTRGVIFHEFDRHHTTITLNRENGWMAPPVDE